MDQLASVALFGSIGIGKSFVARTVLNHDRTRTKFGERRYFMRCHLTTSLEGFLTHLSDVIHTDVELLQSHFRSSPPLMLVLDGVDSILNPLIHKSQEISATIEGFGIYEHVCIVTTSTIYPDIRGFRRVEVPTLSEDSARDIFYARCNLERSSAVDYLLAHLDFHPLFIELLAGRVLENRWDETSLVKAWHNDQMSVLKTCYYQRLKDAIEPALQSEMIKGLGTAAWNVLEAIAGSPDGVEGCELEERIVGAEEVVNVLWKFSLVRHEGRFVKMLLPVRSYFLELRSESARMGEDSHLDIGCIPGACVSPLLLSISSRGDIF